MHESVMELAIERQSPEIGIGGFSQELFQTLADHHAAIEHEIG